jgi:FAD/FMN-containing dehydrogenase
VGGGVAWGAVTAAAARHGLFGLYGTDDSVGVAGYTLGGGVSWFARQHGLASSHLLAAEIVTVDGRMRRVDADHDPDLFWALRGGGGGFGVVTALEFRLFPVVEITAGSLWFPLDRAREVLGAYCAWTGGLGDLATTAIRMMRVPDAPGAPEPLRGKAFVVLQGTIAAPAAIADGLLAPLRLLAPLMDTFRVTTSDQVSGVRRPATE